MAYLLASERPAAAAFSLNPVRYVTGWIANLHEARTQRAALSCLLQMDDFRLEDLGISRQDVLAAVQSPRPGIKLSAARARTASAWLRP